MVIRLVIFLSAVVCLSCNRSLDNASYRAWIQDYANGLHVRKISSDFVFDVQYQPHDYLRVAHSNQGDNLQYYLLKIGVENSNETIIDHNTADIVERQRRNYYYSYRFQDDIFLEEDTVRLPCVLFHFQNSGLARHQTFLLAFEDPLGRSSKRSTLVLESGLLSALPIKIRISKDNIPSLNL